MQPKTKFQKLVAGLSSKLKPISEVQKSWGFKNCFQYQGTLTSKSANCLECGHSWQEDKKLIATLLGSECPGCGKEIKFEVTRKKKHEEIRYYAILSVSGEFQVVRMFYLIKRSVVGTPAVYSCYEVMQHWINAKEESLVMSLLVNGLSGYYDNWILHSSLEVRGTISQSSDLRNSLVPNKIYPRRKILPIIARNGFKGELHGISPIHLFHLILKDSRAETLIKAGQGSLLKRLYQRGNGGTFNQHWNSIKICIRNQYIVEDASIWLDYLDLLQFFRKDLLNSYYVCPVDLRASHDVLVDKKRQLQERQRVIKEKNEPIDYAQLKSKFFGLVFTDGLFTVKVLESIEEFKQEGDALKHCVFVNKYYRKPDSLVLSARIDDKPVETVEISLSSLTIIQSRGFRNDPTEHHTRIINLVRRNIPAIKKLVGK